MQVAVIDNTRKDRLIALLLTLLTSGLLLLFFLFFLFKTPIPPYPPSIVQVVEIDFEGGGGLDGAMGSGNPDVSSYVKSEINTTQTGEDVFASQVEEPLVTVKDDKKKNKKTEKAVQQKSSAQEEPKPSQELLNLISNVKDKLKKSSGPAENADGTGKADGGKGSGKGNSDGSGEGSGMGPGRGPGYSLKGRKLLKWPDLLDESQEEGVVVLAIVVDETGKVIDAVPGQRGSTTTSAYLYTLARQAAKTARFSPSPDGATEQHGTLTITFKLH